MVFLVLTPPVLPINLNFFDSPFSPHGTREASDDDLPCHIAFFGGFFCNSAFFVSPLRATPALRGRFLMGGLPYRRSCVSFNC